MARIERTIEIHANAGTVWDIVSDLRGVATWNPNIASVTCDFASGGVGATRICHMAQGGHIDEVVSAWTPGSGMQFAIGSHGGIRSADMGMSLVPTETGTEVTAVADYHLAFGPLGPVVDRIVVKRQMVRMLDDALAGLKLHIENEKTENPSQKRMP